MFCSLFISCTRIALILYVNIYCCSKCSISGSLDSVGQEWLHEKQSRLGFSKPRFLCAFVLPDATQNQLCAPCFPSPDSAFALCLHFTGGPSCSGRCVCFIWTHPLTPADHKLPRRRKWESWINLLLSRGKYLLRPLKAFANKGDPSTAFKMSLAGFVHLHNL